MINRRAGQAELKRQIGKFWRVINIKKPDPPIFGPAPKFLINFYDMGGLGQHIKPNLSTPHQLEPAQLLPLLVIMKFHDIFIIVFVLNYGVEVRNSKSFIDDYSHHFLYEHIGVY